MVWIGNPKEPTMRHIKDVVREVIQELRTKEVNMRNVGKIIDLKGERGSGIATLTILTNQKERLQVYCDNSPTVRALDAAFGGVVGPGHTFNIEAIRGRWIEFDVDQFGLLLWIRPYDLTLDPLDP